jgi:serine/threonine-protein kinase
LSLPIEVFNENAFRYEVLNYYDGWTLAEIIETNQGNQFGVTACLLHDWTTQLLSLLSTLHKSGIIHRDINPSNILVLRDSLELVLLDFSSAIKYSSKPQIPIGRFGYTPDEQIQGRATPASDVYAAGMVIYSMNSCKPPPVSSARLHRDFPELKIEMYTPLTNIEKVFQRMIELDPQKRYPNALEASSEIRLPDTLMGPFIPDILKLPSGDVVEMTELSWTYTRGDGITIRQQIG